MTLRVLNVFGMLCILGIFLSSIVSLPAQTLHCVPDIWSGMPNCGYTRHVEPIPYVEYDISDMLEGWHDAMLWTVLQEDHPTLQLNTNWWDLLKHLGVSMLFIGFWLVLIGVCWWLDLRRILKIHLNNRAND